MKLFQRLGLGGDKKPAYEEPEEDQGGFGPPGGVLWTTPGDVLSDRPKSAPPVQPTMAPALPEADHAAPAPGVPSSHSDALQRTGLMSTDIAGTAFIAGFVGSCLVDSDSGLLLAAEGDGRIDMEAAAALYTQVVKAEHEVIEVLQLEDHIEDILITMHSQLHFIRPLEKSPSVFLYVALDKKSANLGMARMQVTKIESNLKM
ncbi:hypothetical protein [Rubellimicrobium roseum]|nr:hypothetical protein [Rubellimicrobium roseum]